MCACVLDGGYRNFSYLVPKRSQVFFFMFSQMRTVVITTNFTSFSLIHNTLHPECPPFDKRMTIEYNLLGKEYE